MKTLLLTSALCLSAGTVMAQSGVHEHHHDHAMTMPEAMTAPVAAPQAPDTPKTPIPVPTDADRAAAFPVLKAGHSHGMPVNTLIKLNRLEAWEGEHGGAQGWELTSWTGGDVNRLWVRSSGVHEDNQTSGNLEALYGRAWGPWWDVVGGVRQDFGTSNDRRTWAAFGVQGLAPYKFEVSATGYVGESGQTMANIEAEYDVLFTNRLILQPVVELSAFGKNDPLRGEGSGLSSAEAGLRLRYQVTRRFAPYVGVSYDRALGNTADFKRRQGEKPSETRWVIGLNSWF